MVESGRGTAGWYKNRVRVESTSVAVAQGENEAMPVVRVILREGQEKVYHDAQASIHTPDRTLRITRNQDSIAEFQSEYYQSWEYVEDTSAGTGEDTHTDTSVSGAAGRRKEPSTPLCATTLAPSLLPCASGSAPVTRLRAWGRWRAPGTAGGSRVLAGTLRRAHQ